MSHLVPGIPLDDSLNPDECAVNAAIQYIITADHYIWKMYYDGDEIEFLRRFSPQLDAVKWACKKLGLDFVTGDLVAYFYGKIKYRERTFWNDEGILYSPGNKIKLQNINREGLKYDENNTCENPSEIITVLKNALKIDFNPVCRRRVTDSINLMIEDVSEL